MTASRRDPVPTVFQRERVAFETVSTVFSASASRRYLVATVLGASAPRRDLVSTVLGASASRRDLVSAILGASAPTESSTRTGSSTDNRSVLVARRWLVPTLALSFACLAVDVAPKPKPEPASGTSRPAPAAPTPSFAPATVSEIEGRIIEIPTPERWAAYGRQQSVGVITVEVLDVGEPPPRLQLVVSCPTDRRGDLFVVGATHVFGLYEREQAWPEVDVAADRPARYVKTMADSPG